MTISSLTDSLILVEKGRISKVLAMGIFLIFILLLSISVAVSFGAINIPISTVWQVIGNRVFPKLFEISWNSGTESIIWDIRLPRVLLACLVGSGLSIVGASLQAVTRNPLADPHLLGISAGAAFGAILALLHTGLIFWTPYSSFICILWCSCCNDFNSKYLQLHQRNQCRSSCINWSINLICHYGGCKSINFFG